MSTTPLLQVKELVVEFKTRTGILRALDGVSFCVDAFESVGVLGESGSGKSVSGLAILGLVAKPAGRIVSGRILLKGEDLVQARPRRMREVRGKHVAMVFQDSVSSLNPVFTVGYQIAEVLTRRAGMSRRAARDRAIELMEMVKIPAAKSRAASYPHEFSGGMGQRIMIAMALALGPEVLIADEPTTALDVTVQAQIINLLKELQRENGMALILISHDLGVVAGAADRVSVMYAGRVVESGKIRDVYGKPAHPYTRGLIRSIPSITQRQRLIPIRGAPPNMLDVPRGCAFHPRCPSVEHRCRVDDPALREIAIQRLSACHFAESVIDSPMDVGL